MPKDLKKYNRIISMHMGGFAKAKAYWAEAKEKINKANQPGEFVAMPSYEWHSMEYGDYILYWLKEDPPLIDGENIEDLISHLPNNKTVFLIPHHIGYKQGYRGINWESFRGNVSPAIEVFSAHGCAVSESDPYPYYHSMGPRNSNSTAISGLNRGEKFGLFTLTDDHGAYPGNYEHGRIGVFCNNLTKKIFLNQLEKEKQLLLPVIKWGDPNNLVKWNGNIKVVDGIIKSVEPYFRGISSLDPSANKTDLKSYELEDKIIKQNNVSVNWVSQTKGNKDSLRADTSLKQILC